MDYPCGEIIDVEQGTDQWFATKCGVVSASHMSDVMAKGKNGQESTSYANYRAKIVAERMTGITSKTFSNHHTERGITQEPAARCCYEFVNGVDVAQVGFVRHPTLDFAGCSPDGMPVGGGLMQIKCQIPAIHINCLLKKEVPSEYVKQMQFEMACTGEVWNDFVSYCPDMPEDLQLFICRLHRDDKAIAEMQATAIIFNRSVEKMIADLRAIRP